MQVILFDGVCNLCNAAVNWIIDHDKQNRFRFASLQSNYGRQITEQYHLTDDYLDTIVLLDNDQVLLRAQAVLRILKYLGGIYGLLYIFNVLPSPILNFFYNIVAKYRYRWFGKRESCRVPDADIKQKFIE
jgi:predicted DCC family thiol-disulfide oxidoreductase YuxK